MKTLGLAALGVFAMICCTLAGCETNHPDETPEVTEVSAALLASGPGVPMAGWWVIVCPKKTESDYFRISVGPDDHNITQKVIWHQGDPLQFELLHGRDYNQIYVAAYSGTDGKQAYFGVCHESQICNRHYEVNQTEQSGGEGHLIQASDTDVWDCN